MDKITKFTKDHLIGISGVVIGALIGILIPVWQIYWVERPKIDIEITAISRELSNSAGIYLHEYNDLSFLERSIPYEARYEFIEGRRSGLKDSKQVFLNLDQLKITIEKAKQDKTRYSRTYNVLNTIYSKYQNLAEDFSYDEIFDIFYEEVEKVSDDFVYYEPEFLYDSEDNLTKDYVIQQMNRALIDFKKEVDRYNPLSEAEKKILQIIDQIEARESYFKITTAITNTGKASVSIKKPALLRIYIGTGHYVDLKLLMTDFEKHSEIPNSRTKVIGFESTTISKSPDEDQLTINNYWGKSVQSILFVEDSYGKIISSSPITFSEGIYQKIVYDKLSTEASNNKYFEIAK